jgi:hypothetical protein
MPRPHSPLRKIRGTLCMSLGGPQSQLDTEGRGKILHLHRGSNPSRPVSSQSLYRLSYPCHIRIMASAESRDLCRCLFKRLESLPLPCIYIFPLMSFTVNNQEYFQTNSASYSVKKEIGMTYIDKLPTIHIFRKVHTTL